MWAYRILGLKPRILKLIAEVFGPETLMIPTLPRPGGVEIAQIVVSSERDIVSKFSFQNDIYKLNVQYLGLAIS